MTDFAKLTKHSLVEFKNIYRNNLPKKFRQEIEIENLKIKRAEINRNTDIELYAKVQQIIKHLEAKTNSNKSKLQNHQGLEDFIAHLQILLDDHTEIFGRIVHKGIYVSEVLVRAIQIITLEKIKLNHDSFERLLRCCKIIVSLGNAFHYEKLMYAIEHSKQRNPVFFARILEQCKQLMREKQFYDK